MSYENERDEDREGSRKKRGKAMELIIAHFNPRELEVMDREQGGRTHIPGTDTPHYKGLEKLMSNSNVEHLVRRAFEKHAEGGRIGESARDIEDMKRKGRFGDSEMAYIGPNTRRIFDRITADLTGNSKKNAHPSTGKPEYFGLGSFLGGIGKTVSKGVSSLGNMAGQAANGVMHAAAPVAQGLGNFAMNAAPGAIMGGLMGGPAGALEGGMMGGMQGMMGGQGGSQGGSQPSSYQMPQNLGQAFSGAMQSPYGQQMQQQGQNAYNQANQGYQQMANSPMARTAMGAYNGVMGTNHQMPQNLADAGRQAMNSPMGQQMQQHGQNMYNQADQGYQNVRNQGQQMMNNAQNQWQQNPYAQGARGAYQGYQGNR